MQRNGRKDQELNREGESEAEAEAEAEYVGADLVKRRHRLLRNIRDGSFFDVT